MNWETLYLFCVASSLLALAPGPDNIFVMLQSMAHGVRSGFFITLGLISGCLIHTALVAFGVAVLIKQSEVAFVILKLAGAAYLLFLAYKVYKSQAELRLDATEKPKKSFASLFAQGFLMNVLNPKVALFFLALFPGFLFHDELQSVYQFFILGLLFMLISLVVFVTLGYLSGKLAVYLKGNRHAAAVLKWGQILVFVGIAVFIML